MAVLVFGKSRNGKRMPTFWRGELFLGKRFLLFGQWHSFLGKERFGVRKANFKGKCVKWKALKCGDSICRTYDEIQRVYAEQLSVCEEVKSFQCNVLLNGLQEGAYTSDFVITKADGDLMVRECVERKHLTKPLTVRLLQASREFWLRHGVSDWGIVVEKEV